MDGSYNVYLHLHQGTLPLNCGRPRAKGPHTVVAGEKKRPPDEQRQAKRQQRTFSRTYVHTVPQRQECSTQGLQHGSLCFSAWTLLGSGCPFCQENLEIGRSGRSCRQESHLSWEQLGDVSLRREPERTHSLEVCGGGASKKSI